MADGTIDFIILHTSPYFSFLRQFSISVELSIADPSNVFVIGSCSGPLSDPCRFWQRFMADLAILTNKQSDGRLVWIPHFRCIFQFFRTS